MKSFCVDRSKLSKEQDEELYLSLLEVAENGDLKPFSEYAEASDDAMFMGVSIGRIFIHKNTCSFCHNLLDLHQVKELLRNIIHA